MTTTTKRDECARCGEMAGYYVEQYRALWIHDNGSFDHTVMPASQTKFDVQMILPFKVRKFA